MAFKKIYFLFFAFFAFSALRLVRSEDEFEDEEGEENVGTVIGIDLGTTYSVVGVYQNGKVDIIANDQGNRITPSYVAFTDEERLVGESAKNQASKNPENTVYSVKRLIGRTYSEKSVQRDIKFFPYKVTERKGKPAITVTDRKKKTTLTPEEISAMVLSKMKETAESYLGTKVTHAVVTVPAYFNDAQRKATKDAGTIAGLNVMRIINEPTAAAIAYGIDKNKETEMNVLVYDLGGGTFDVSILTVDGGVFEVKATNGITHLGGEDFDVNLAKELARRFKKKTGVSLMTDKRAYSKLKRESERAKRSLSSQHSVKVEIEDIVKGRNLEETITRAEFEQLNMKLFRETLKPVRTVLADAKMKKKNIDEVVLVGGSTRIPAVQKLLGEFFEGKKLHKEINPDEAIAYGAAVQAVILSGAKNEETKDLLLLDVTPLSLGIETVGGVHTKVITKNTPIPTSKAQTFTTNENDQTSVTITVYQGESRMVKSSHRIGHFELSGIEKAPRGVPQIEVTFEIDANGILLVTAKDKASGKNNKLKIDEAMTGANSEEVKRMKENFEKYKEEDERTFNRTVAKNKLDASLHRAEDYKKKNEKKLSEADLDDLESFVNEMREWNNGADVADTETKEFEEKTKEVEEMLQDLDSGEGEAGGEPVEEEEEEESEENDNKKEL